MDVFPQGVHGRSPQLSGEAQVVGGSTAPSLQPENTEGNLSILAECSCHTGGHVHGELASPAVPVGKNGIVTS